MPLREISPLREKHKFSIQSIGTRHTQMFCNYIQNISAKILIRD